MSTRFIKTVTLLACAVFSSLALAADAPTRVGRVALAQGQVSISSDVSNVASVAQVNWPVTSRNLVTTGPGARTEIRIGSTSVRVDGDSSLEVTELDDDSLRLRLNYGSVNVRILNADVLRGFELGTPNGLVRLEQPGRLRVDAERERGTTVVNVFDGVARVEDRGSQLIVRAGKRAEIRDEDVRTGLAMRDGFDDWSQQRDRLYDNSTSVRYVTSEMTGYEDLDRNGVWSDDADYGPLWLPRTVGPDWVPYRDGSWTWIEPWGWTWVDNAPWGYAPFHYGRWVYVHQRWAWAPGRHIGRPVWAPALVGWVGGGGWSARFGSGHGHRPLPAQGWYPLSPRDVFVPGYRLSHDHLQHINRDARPDGHDGRRGHDGRDGRGDHRQGLTVVPHDQFGRQGPVVVHNVPKAVVPPVALQNAPGAAPPPPPPQGGARDGRFGRDANQRGRGQGPETAQRPPVAMPAPPMIVGQPQAAPPAPSPRRDGRIGFEDRGQRPQPAPAVIAPPPVVAAPAPAPAVMPGSFGRRDGRDFEDRRQRPQPAPVAPQPQVVAPAPQPVMPPPEQAQRGRGFRNDGERRMREPDPGPAAPPPQPRQLAPAPVFHQQTAPAPAPAPPMAAPPVHQQPAPVAAPAPVFQQRPAPPPAPAPVAMPAPVQPPAAAPQPPAPRNNTPAVERKRGNEAER
jgi:hypothetical protein